MKKIVQVMSNGTRNVIEDTDINCYRRKVILNGLKNEDMKVKIMELCNSQSVSLEQEELINELLNVNEIIDIQDDELDIDNISLSVLE